MPPNRGQHRYSMMAAGQGCQEANARRHMPVMVLSEKKRTRLSICEVSCIPATGSCQASVVRVTRAAEPCSVKTMRRATDRCTCYQLPEVLYKVYITHTILCSAPCTSDRMHERELSVPAPCSERQLPREGEGVQQAPEEVPEPEMELMQPDQPHWLVRRVPHMLQASGVRGGHRMDALEPGKVVQYAGDPEPRRGAQSSRGCYGLCNIRHQSLTFVDQRTFAMV